jgi:methylated-DNA-protein-cysteine methyltransferase-like protein
VGRPRVAGAVTSALSRYERIYRVVRRIPRGRVASYGEVARLAGLPGAARQVGYALAALPEASALPWHRVVNARGAISPRASGFETPQRLLLEREGLRFDGAGRIDLERFGWAGAAHETNREPKGRSRR